MDRRLLHVDIDAFLASVEQLRDPSLLGRPVAVGTGVVASRSYEAKARGVATAMPLHEALRRCPELVVRDGDARLVERYRQRVAEVLRQFSPVVEVCSLDDFYVDLTGVSLRVEQALAADATVDAERSLAPLCREVRAAVRAATGLSVAQGVGSTRTVARMATTRAKPGGICEVPAGGEVEFLAGFPVEALPGVGPARAALLQQVGVRTVRELCAVDRELLRASFGAGLGVSMERSPQNGYARGGADGGRNELEAEMIALAVIDFARRHPEKSLGVAAFSVKQRDAIRDMVDQQRVAHPDTEAFFSQARPEHFFIKNLESIQGDERDVIFISVGYGRDQHGRLLGTLWIDDRDINREMVLDGQAWVFGGFAPDEELLAAEADARKGRRGLWSDSRPVSPAEWRSAHPSHR